MSILVVIEERHVEQRVAQLLGLNAHELEGLIEVGIAGLVDRFGALPARIFRMALGRYDVQLAVGIGEAAGIHRWQVSGPHHRAVQAVEALPIADRQLQPA